jgi:hypothetical protein
MPKINGFEFHDEPLDGFHVIVGRKAGTTSDKAIVYFPGGGSRRWQLPYKSSIKKYIGKTGAELWIPLYPLLPDHDLLEETEFVIRLHEKMLKRFQPENIVWLGFSGGADILFQAGRHIVQKYSDIPMPGMMIPVSCSGLIVSDEANGIEWLKLQLKEPKTYQEISPEWMQAVKGLRKGDVLPELKDILEENFIEDETGHWHVPDLEKQIDLEKLKHKSLMKEFNLYKEMAQKPRARIKEVRVEALREGFKQCFKDKDFATILLLGDKIPQNILTEDEQLLQYYDIAQMRA